MMPEVALVLVLIGVAIALAVGRWINDRKRAANIQRIKELEQLVMRMASELTAVHLVLNQYAPDTDTR